MLDGAIPFDSNGVLPLPKLELKEQVVNFYENKGINEDLVFEELEDRFYKFIEAICTGNEDQVRALTEKRFGDKVAELLPNVKSHNLKFSREESKLEKLNSLVVENTTDYGSLRKNFISDIEHSYTIDSVLVRGLSPHRHENGYNYDYELEVSGDNGAKYYRHRYFLGFAEVYHLSEVQKQREELFEIIERQSEKKQVEAADSKLSEQETKGKKKEKKDQKKALEEELVSVEESVRRFDLETEIRENMYKMKKEMMTKQLR